jgi:transposase-like protein
MQVKGCPRCGSIDKKGKRNKDTDETEYECQQCGKLYYGLDARMIEFKDRPKFPKVVREEPFLFEEMNG